MLTVEIMGLVFKGFCEMLERSPLQEAPPQL